MMMLTLLRVFVCRRLRALFGKDILSNAIHGPSNRISAENQIRLIFGDVEFDEEGFTVPISSVLSFSQSVNQSKYLFSALCCECMLPSTRL